MYYRKLGRTGCLVGEIGLAARYLPDDQLATSLVQRALERGVNVVDVSAADAEALRQVGRAIKGRREQVLLSLRIGRIEDAEDGEALVRQAHESLAALNCEYLDLLQLYLDASGPMPAAGLADAAERLRTAGTVRHIGAVACSPQAAEEAVALGIVETIQIPLNPIDVEMLDVLPRARQAGLGVLVCSPFASGLLSGDPGMNEAATSAGDEDAEKLSAARPLAERIHRLIEDSGRTPAQATLGWVLAQEDVSVVLPAASTTAQFVEYLDASDLPLPTPRQLAAIQHARLTFAAI